MNRTPLATRSATTAVMGSLRCVESGAPAWADLGTAAGTTSAARFYCSLFGWSVVARHRPLDEASGYWVFQRSGNNVGGLAAAPAREASWTVYLGVADVDATVESVTRNGGSVVTEPVSTTAGRMAVCADPLGGTFVLWQSDAADGTEAVNEPTSFAWYQLCNRDVETAKRFYTAVFGWTATTTPFAEGSTYTAFVAPGTERTVAGMVGLNDPDHNEASPRWMVNLTVTDTDDTALRAAELGGTVEVAPVDLPNVGRIAVLNDPESAVFSVLQAA